MPEHGEYQAGKGFYDSAQTRGGAWIEDRAKLTRRIDHPVAAHHKDEFEQQQAKRSAKKQNDQMEHLIRLRDSDRPDDRAKYEQVASPSMRMQLGSYEAEKAKADDGD